MSGSSSRAAPPTRRRFSRSRWRAHGEDAALRAACSICICAGSRGLACALFSWRSTKTTRRRAACTQARASGGPGARPAIIRNPDARAGWYCGGPCIIRPRITDGIVVNDSRPNFIEAQCAAKGMRMTEQRRVIARVLADSADHPDVEELYRRCSKIDEHISISTVYRTVKLFEDSGI